MTVFILKVPSLSFQFMFGNMDPSVKVLILISFFLLSVGSHFNLVHAGGPFYGPDSAVLLVNTADFKCKIVDQPQVAIVQFYAPWCPPCQDLKPVWEQAAGALKGVVLLAAIDADANKDIKKEYPIPGYPTCKLFVPGKPPVDFRPPNDPTWVVNYAMDALKTYIIEDKLKGGCAPDKKEL